jgi:cysteinyl-tRNA synthetase
MSLRIYSTLTRRKEAFEPLNPGQVRIYVCGPTVYDKAHIGHAMSSLVYDVIRRYLEYRGYQVRHVMNFTDVDDKIIQKANQLGKDPLALAEEYIGQYQRHLEDFNVLPATVMPRASQEIEQIIAMVTRLIESGHAYDVDGDVYFLVTSDPDYGKLSGRKVKEMLAGARVEVDERKENPMDFALWKSSKPGEPSWDSPWGPGRPGWHIECSAMNLHHLGEQIDIHGGGNELTFPHHENEIAQTESLTGKRFVQFWVHNGLLQLSGEKMSKSLGNIVTVEDFLARHEADALRMMILNSSYRSPLTFNEEVVAQAERSLERLRAALRPVSIRSEYSSGVDTPAVAEDQPASGDAAQTLKAQAEATQQGFIEAMDDDFNTAGALGHLFDLVRAINQARDSGVGAEELEGAKSVLRGLAEGVFGLRLERPGTQGLAAAPFVDLLVEVRSELRKEKLWQLSDLVRDRLAELGVALEDGKDGTSWRFKNRG